MVTVIGHLRFIPRITQAVAETKNLYRPGRSMVGDSFNQGVLNPLRRKFSVPPKQKIFLIGELRSTQFKELYQC